MMKMIVVILHNTDGEDTLQSLTQAGFRVTRVAATRGFLRRGNATLLIGVDEKQVPDAMQILREHSAPAIDPGQKRATVFVLKVDQFEQI